MDAIKELRDKTGISVMQCKRALEESGGDMEKALVILRKAAGAAAAKKADRALGAGAIQSYIHGNGAVGVLVELRSETDFVSGNADFMTLARDIAMHVAASSPQYLKREDVPEAALTSAREVFEKEAEGKPAEVKEKIVAGKMDSYWSQIVLLEQPFIKEPERTIKDLIEAATQKFGEKIELTRFTRFAMRD